MSPALHPTTTTFIPLQTKYFYFIRSTNISIVGQLMHRYLSRHKGQSSDQNNIPGLHSAQIPGARERELLCCKKNWW